MAYWLKKHIPSISLYIFLLVLATGSMTVLNLRIAEIFQAAMTKDFVLLLKLFLILFVWFIVTRLMDYWADSLSTYIINKIRENIKTELFEKYISQSVEDYAVKDAGKYVADFTNDITMIEAKSLISYRELAKSILTVVMGNIAIFSINPIFNIIVIIGIILCIAIPYSLIRYTTTPMNEFINSFEGFVQNLKDFFNSFFTIKNFAAEEQFEELFYDKNAKIEEKKLKAEITIDFVNNLIGRLAWSVELAVIAVGAIQVVQGKIEVSLLFSAYLLCSEVCMPLQSITGHINNIKSVSGITKKNKGHKKVHDASENSFDNNGEITAQFDHFSLTKNSNRIIEDISFEFLPGKKYLIIGSNGSGKSTLVKSLKKVYQSYDGNIFINGRELRTISDDVLSQIAIYSNETVPMFTDTIKNNITLFRCVSDESLENVLMMSRFKNPLERKLIDRGKNISSGEKRKLELSRALLSDASIFIFDEVISTLDIETAYEIEQIILSLNKTVIMVSNAFSGQLLRSYDEILLINNGKLINHGPHDYLLNNCDEYKQIYHVRCEL